MKNDVAWIFGTSRSGSTWLGSILNAHPRVAYRFEPIHRRRGDPRIREARTLLESGGFHEVALSRIHELLLEADPATEKPPFFRKSYPLRFRFARPLLWPLARKLKLFRPLFRAAYTPRSRPFLVVKEVNLERVMERLAAETSIPIVYLVRHPCAVVWSHLVGQRQGMMGDVRERDVHLRLEEEAPELRGRFPSDPEAIGKVERRALLWRLSVDRALAGTAGNRSVLWLHYEDLCRDPEGGTRAVLKHVGLDEDPGVLAFVRESTGAGTGSRLRRAEIFSNRYFSVFRDPRKAMDHWKEEMPPEDQSRVLRVVQDSKAFLRGVAEADWWNAGP